MEAVRAGEEDTSGGTVPKLRRVRVERAADGAPVAAKGRPRRRKARDMGLPRVLHAQPVAEPVSGV